MRVLLVTDLTTPSQLGAYEALELVATLTASEFTISRVRQHAPDIIVATLQDPIPSVLREFALLDEIDGVPVTYIDYSNNQKATIPHLAEAAGVTSFVPTSQSPIDVMTLLEWTRLRFKTLQATRKTLAETEKKLADHIVIERAKGLMMKTQGIGEEKAYRTLRNLSMRRAVPMSITAQAVLDASGHTPRA